MDMAEASSEGIPGIPPVEWICSRVSIWSQDPVRLTSTYSAKVYFDCALNPLKAPIFRSRLRHTFFEFSHRACRPRARVSLGVEGDRQAPILSGPAARHCCPIWRTL